MQVKPLLHRRTFWKGFAAGATVMSAVIVLGVWVVYAVAPRELSRGVQPTREPLPIPHHTAQFRSADLGPCDTRGKDCVVFQDPFAGPVRTVPEPSSLWLVGLAGALVARRGMSSPRCGRRLRTIYSHTHRGLPCSCPGRQSSTS